MSDRYLDPTNDVAFKKIFSDKERLKSFLNAVLRLEEGQKIVDLDFIPQEELPDFKVGRRSIFDIKCVDQSGKTYIVEMQNRSETSFLNRIQCYASHAYVSQAIKGATHQGLMPVILVAITKHKVFDDSVEWISFHSTIESKTKKQHLFALSYLFVELPKFTKDAAELLGDEDEWLHFFANWKEDKRPPETIKDPLVLEAYETVEQFNWSPEEYDAYFRARLAAEADDLIIEKNREEGKAEGIAEGEKKSQIKIAHVLKAKGMAISLIAEITGLSEAEIENL